MDANELRALAHALEPMAAAPCFDGIDIAAAADYLRAQADAQPVEWRVDARYAGERRWSPYLHCRSQHEAEQMATIAAQANVETRIVPLYAHPAPAAPQAEPKREPLPGLAPTHRCPACGALWRQCDDASWNLRSALCCGLCDDGRVELVRLLDEPKREPLTARRILEIEDDASRQWRDNGRIIEYAVVFARMIERAHGIGGSDAE